MRAVMCIINRIALVLIFSFVVTPILAPLSMGAHLQLKITVAYAEGDEGTGCTANPDNNKNGQKDDGYKDIGCAASGGTCNQQNGQCNLNDATAAEQKALEEAQDSSLQNDAPAQLTTSQIVEQLAQQEARLTGLLDAAAAAKINQEIAVLKALQEAEARRTAAAQQLQQLIDTPTASAEDIVEVRNQLETYTAQTITLNSQLRTDISTLQSTAAQTSDISGGGTNQGDTSNRAVVGFGSEPVGAVLERSWLDIARDGVRVILDTGAEVLTSTGNYLGTLLGPNSDPSIPSAQPDQSAGPVLTYDANLPRTRLETLRQEYEIAYKNYLDVAEPPANLSASEYELLFQQRWMDLRIAELQLEDYDHRVREAYGVPQNVLETDPVTRENIRDRILQRLSPQVQDLVPGSSDIPAPGDTEPSAWLCRSYPCEAQDRSTLSDVSTEPQSSLPTLAQTPEELLRSLESGAGGVSLAELQSARERAEEQLRLARQNMETRSALQIVGDSLGISESPQAQALRDAETRARELARAEYAYNPDLQLALYDARKTLEEARQLSEEIRSNEFFITPSRLGMFSPTLPMQPVFPMDRFSFAPSITEPPNWPLTSADLAQPTQTLTIPIPVDQAPPSNDLQQPTLVPVYEDGVIVAMRNWETQELLPIKPDAQLPIIEMPDVTPIKTSAVLEPSPEPIAQLPNTPVAASSDTSIGAPLSVNAGQESAPGSAVNTTGENSRIPGTGSLTPPTNIGFFGTLLQMLGQLFGFSRAPQSPSAVSTTAPAAQIHPATKNCTIAAGIIEYVLCAWR